MSEKPPSNCHANGIEEVLEYIGRHAENDVLKYRTAFWIKGKLTKNTDQTVECLEEDCGVLAFVIDNTSETALAHPVFKGSKILGLVLGAPAVLPETLSPQEAKKISKTFELILLSREGAHGFYDFVDLESLSNAYVPGTPTPQ